MLTQDEQRLLFAFRTMGRVSKRLQEHWLMLTETTAQSNEVRRAFQGESLSKQIDPNDSPIKLVRSHGCRTT